MCLPICLLFLRFAGTRFIKNFGPFSLLLEIVM